MISLFFFYSLEVSIVYILFINMSIHWVAMTYDVVESETVVHYIIRHDFDAILSWKVLLEPIAVNFCTHTYREDFQDGCLTVVTVMYAISTPPESEFLLSGPRDGRHLTFFLREGFVMESNCIFSVVYNNTLKD